MRLTGDKTSLGIESILTVLCSICLEAAYFKYAKQWDTALQDSFGAIPQFKKSHSQALLNGAYTISHAFKKNFNSCWEC